MTKTVMLIDDSPTVRQVMRFALERAGFGVVEAGNGKEALRQLDGRSMGAIVCDMAMPEMGGMEFLEQLRTRNNYRFTPVVMLTTESRAEKKADAKQLGAQAWATKPCPPSQLVDIVKRFVK